MNVSHRLIEFTFFHIDVKIFRKREKKQKREKCE